MRIGVVVQARVGSSRLPGKVLLPFGAGSVLDHVLARCEQSTVADVVGVATTDQPADDAIAARCAARATPVVRGSEHDVLSRYRLAVDELGLDVVVRVTADCPFVWHEDIDAVAAVARDAPEAHYATNRGCAHGLNVEATTADWLRMADAAATDHFDREHVMPFLYRLDGRDVREVLPADGSGNAGLRLTLDTVADYGLLATLRGRADGLDVEPTPRWLVQAMRDPVLMAWHERVLTAATATAGAPAPVRVDGCEVCGILDRLGPAGHPLDGGWVLNGNVSPRVRRPALVLSTATHRGHIDQLGDAEASWLGRHLRRLDGAARKVLGAERLYVLLLNEAGHVHLHLVPRYPGDDPAGFDPALLRLPPPAPATMPADAVRAVLAELS
jgi:spore coat polysaccharide biosynthesis protein SpsF